MTRRPQFTNCYDRGRRFFSKSFVLFVRVREDGALSWRLGLAVSKKIGNSVRRNRVKRLIREFFRLQQHDFILSADIVVVPKRGLCVQTLGLAQVRAELDPLMKRIASASEASVLP